MVSFNNLRTQLLSESIRQGLPHITSMTPDQFGSLIQNGHVPLHHITEKTDGSTLKFGYDQHGFYTQSSGSGSEKMRTAQHHLDRTTKRAKETGREPDYTGARAFAEAHESLHRNKALQDHLRSEHERTGKDVEVRGELFSRQLARPSDETKDEVKLVGTSYDPSRWRSKGQIVIHSNLPENAHHDLSHFKNNLSNDEFNFEDDKIDIPATTVETRGELHHFSNLNHDLLRSRTTKTNKAAKMAEIAKFDAIKKSVSDKVDNHIASLGIHGKFGTGSEGLVIHPGPQSIAPRFKVTTPKYREYKEKIKRGELSFKKRNMNPQVNLNPINEQFSSYLTEGGNIKVNGVKAAPFPVTPENRASRAIDVHDALEALHNHFHAVTGQHLFGKKAKALKTGSAFSGSSRQFMDPRISDKDYAFYKPATGDIDIAIPHEHKDALAQLLQPGTRLGHYTYVGSRGHGNQVSYVMNHDNGETHQFDFEGTDYKNNEPTMGSQFLNSSHWEDTKLGIRGAHHKILLNAAGGPNMKFSITHGLRSRIDETDPGTKDPIDVSRRLFGDKANHDKITSFTGAAQLIRDHIPQERHQEIYDKFKSSLIKTKGNHENALGYLATTLGIKDKDHAESHASTVPFVGFSPISHMGHAIDLGGALQKLPGTKTIGISEKADLFSPTERAAILNRQLGDFGQKVSVAKGVGEILRQAHDSLPKKGRKVLHLLLGADRQDYGENLRKALISGRIKEMEGNKFDRIELHAPEDVKRKHGMSGTKMRQAAADGNIDEFHRHLGPMFGHEEAKTIMGRVSSGIQSGQVPLLREETSHKELKPLLTSFSDFAAKELDLKKIPVVHFKNEKEYADVTSFGGYNPHTKEILLQTKNRHPMDIFRTLAHEFVHAKQHEDDKIGHDIELEGKTGSEHENEANAMAGVIMRKFGRKHPNMFELEPLSEAIFVVGGPCCGKDRIVKYLKEAFFIPEFDIASFNQKTAEQNDKIVISAPAHDLSAIRSANEQLKALNYKTSMIFVDVENNISKLRNEERAKRGQRVINESVRFEKYTTSKNNIETFREMFGENMTVIDNSLTEEKKDPCWKGYEMVGMKMKGKRKVPNCVPVSEMDKKFTASMLKQDDPISGKLTPSKPLSEKKCTCEDECKCNKKKKIMRKRLAQEAENSSQLSTASGAIGLPVSDSLGAEYGVAKSPSIISGLTGVTPVSQGATAIYPFGTYGISESVQAWLMKEETQQRFIKKYGNLAEQKMIETGVNISKSMQTENKLRPKHFNELREAIDKTPMMGKKSEPLPRTSSAGGTVPSAGRYQDGDLDEDWSDVKHQDPRGGLKASGVRAYRREHPGSKLKTAVREKPSQLKKGGKRWNRRKSYCARSEGQLKMWPKAAKDPNSRLRKARRAWNCEE